MKTTVQQTEAMGHSVGMSLEANRRETSGKSNHREKKLGTRSYVLIVISQDTSLKIVRTGTKIKRITSESFKDRHRTLK